jgi:hypothetical protein
MIKRFLPWIILIAFALGAWLILKNPPSVQRGAPSACKVSKLPKS